MNLDSLLENLNNPNAKIRQSTVLILGMVDEVRAIGLMRKRYARESNRNVKQAMQTVGGQLAKLKRDEYDTVDAILEHFGVIKEMKAAAAAAEDRIIKNIQQSAAHNKKDDDFNDKLWSAASGAIQVGLMASGLSGPMATGSANVDLSSNLSSTADAVSRHSKRTPPMRPGEADIRVWVERLQSETDTETRCQIIAQLASMNNPAALPYLAHVHWFDDDEQVKAAARKFGRLLYWNLLYWEMTQDGTLNQFMQQKADELGITLPDDEPEASAAPHPPPQPDDIADILAKAEEKRKKRRRK